MEIDEEDIEMGLDCCSGFESEQDSTLYMQLPDSNMQDSSQELLETPSEDVETSCNENDSVPRRSCASYTQFHIAMNTQVSIPVCRHGEGPLNGDWLRVGVSNDVKWANCILSLVIPTLTGISTTKLIGPSTCKCRGGAVRYTLEHFDSNDQLITCAAAGFGLIGIVYYHTNVLKVGSVTNTQTRSEFVKMIHTLIASGVVDSKHYVSYVERRIGSDACKLLHPCDEFNGISIRNTPIYSWLSLIVNWGDCRKEATTKMCANIVEHILMRKVVNGYRVRWATHILLTSTNGNDYSPRKIAEAIVKRGLDCASVFNAPSKSHGFARVGYIEHAGAFLYDECLNIAVTTKNLPMITFLLIKNGKYFWTTIKDDKLMTLQTAVFGCAIETFFECSGMYDHLVRISVRIITKWNKKKCKPLHVLLSENCGIFHGNPERLMRFLDHIEIRPNILPFLITTSKFTMHTQDYIDLVLNAMRSAIVNGVMSPCFVYKHLFEAHPRLLLEEGEKILKCFGTDGSIAMHGKPVAQSILDSFFTQHRSIRNEHKCKFVVDMIGALRKITSKRDILAMITLAAGNRCLKSKSDAENLREKLMKTAYPSASTFVTSGISTTPRKTTGVHTGNPDTVLMSSQTKRMHSDTDDGLPLVRFKRSDNKCTPTGQGISNSQFAHVLLHVVLPTCIGILINTDQENENPQKSVVSTMFYYINKRKSSSYDLSNSDEVRYKTISKLVSNVANTSTIFVAMLAKEVRTQMLVCETPEKCLWGLDRFVDCCEFSDIIRLNEFVCYGTDAVSETRMSTCITGYTIVLHLARMILFVGNKSDLKRYAMALGFASGPSMYESDIESIANACRICDISRADVAFWILTGAWKSGNVDKVAHLDSKVRELFGIRIFDLSRLVCMACKRSEIGILSWYFNSDSWDADPTVITERTVKEICRNWTAYDVKHIDTANCRLSFVRTEQYEGLSEKIADYLAERFCTDANVKASDIAAIIGLIGSQFVLVILARLLYGLSLDTGSKRTTTEMYRLFFDVGDLVMGKASQSILFGHIAGWLLAGSSTVTLMNTAIAIANTRDWNFEYGSDLKHALIHLASKHDTLSIASTLYGFHKKPFEAAIVLADALYWCVIHNNQRKDVKKILVAMRTLINETIHK